MLGKHFQNGTAERISRNIDCDLPFRISERHARCDVPTGIPAAGLFKLRMSGCQWFKRNYPAGIAIGPKLARVMSTVGPNVQYQIDSAGLQQALKLRPRRSLYR